MKIKYLLAASIVSLSTAGLMATPAAAQQITSGVEGQVTDEAGTPLRSATVLITDTRTGSGRTVTTDADGFFRAGNLITGGPYTVTASAPGFEGQTVEGLQINLSGNTSLTFNLTSGSDDNVIVVTAARANVSQLAIGPGQSFNQEVLETFPTISRDIRDFIRIDPRVSLEREGGSTVDRISCLGGNDRTNTFTVDGIIQADNFGLNGTPFAARNSLPLPFDSIRETSVEFAPFDVEYGQFTGCAVNVVTKSGQNTFHGSAFFSYQNSDLTGDNIAGTPAGVPDFQNKRWGATLSGPIIPDHVFFHVGYEEGDFGGGIQDLGPTGAGFVNEQEFIDLATFNDIASIVESTYGIEVGELGRALPETNTRYFGRLDWFINDQHRLEVTYQKLDESKTLSDDFGSEQVTGLGSYRAEGTSSDYYAARIFSEWTDNLSTEVRVSRADVMDIQDPLNGGEAQNGNPIPRIIVGVENPVTGDRGTFQAGPGQFRSANALQTQIDQLKFKVNLLAGDHDLTFGTEINELDVFNLFASNATGTFYFKNIDDLRAGLLSPGSNYSTFATSDDVVTGDAGGFLINATPSGDINEAAASFTRTIFTFYAQDKWRVNDQLSLLGGVRVDFFDGDAPRANPNFLARYGFTNKNPFSQLGPVIQPRLGLTYDLDNDGLFSGTQIKGGLGIFSGGDPTVWFSNAFSNNGFSTAQGDIGAAGCAGLPKVGNQVDVTPNGGAFTGVPACAVADGSSGAAAGLADTQSTDPNLKIPTVLRANFGISTGLNFTGNDGFFDNWRLNADYIFSRFQNPFNFVDLSQVVDTRKGVNGFTTDGRPIYAAIDPTATNCNAVLQNRGGTPPTYTGVTAACFSTRRDDEIQLTNALSGYSSHVASLALSKQFRGGVFTDGGSTSFSLGYAYTNSKDRRSLSSSTSTSNYDVVATFDRQLPALATAATETAHNITWAMNFKETFIEDYETNLGFVFIARSGRPYSLTFDGGGVFNDSSSGSDNALLYVPTGLNDANVSPLSDAGAVQSVIDYVNGSGCKFTAGQSIKRNSCRNDWYFDLDLRLSQEIPGPARLFGVEDKIELFMDFDNFLNFVDPSWNVLRRRSDFVDLVDVDVDPAGRYIISGFNPDDDNDAIPSASRWAIQVGVRYEF